MQSAEEHSEKLRLHTKYIRRLHPFDNDDVRRQYEREVDEVGGWPQFAELEFAIHQSDAREYEEHLERVHTQEMSQHLLSLRRLGPYVIVANRDAYEQHLDLLGPGGWGAFEYLEVELAASDARQLEKRQELKFNSVDDIQNVESLTHILDSLDTSDDISVQPVTVTQQNGRNDLQSEHEDNRGMPSAREMLGLDLDETKRKSTFEEFYERVMSSEVGEESENANE